MRAMIAVGHGGIYSGGSHQAFYALKGLKALGVQAAAVWGEDVEGDPAGFDRLHQAGIPLFIIPIHRRPTAAGVRAFRRAVREFKPDVLECVKSGAQYHALLAGLPRRTALIFYRGISRRMDWFQGWKYRLGRVDGVIANCSALKDVMARTGHIPAGKIEVIYGEFDPACAEPDAVDGSGVREEFGIPAGVPLAVMLGNWSPWRGQQAALEALAKLVAKAIPLHILFAGRETERLNPMVERLGLKQFVTLSAYRRDPERLLKAADFAVNFSTQNESLSGALLNAQAMGLPAAASALAGSPEIVADGESGIIVPVGDVTAAAAAMERLATMGGEERRRMSERARSRALALFSAPARAQKRMEFYSRAVAGRRGGREP